MLLLLLIHLVIRVVDAVLIVDVHKTIILFNLLFLSI